MERSTQVSPKMSSSIKWWNSLNVFMRLGIHLLILFHIQLTMAKVYTSPTGNNIQTTPKKTRQGQGKNTKYSPTSRNSARKPYRGQGK